jgi:hypothetical protein
VKVRTNGRFDIAGVRGVAGIRLFQRGDVATTIEELRHLES